MFSSSAAWLASRLDLVLFQLRGTGLKSGVAFTGIVKGPGNPVQVCLQAVLSRFLDIDLHVDLLQLFKQIQSVFQISFLRVQIWYVDCSVIHR